MRDCLLKCDLLHNGPTSIGATLCVTYGHVRATVDDAPEYEDLGSTRHRRPWTVTEKLRLVKQTYEPGISVGRVARGNGVDHKLLRRWRRLANRGVFGEAGTERHCIVCTEPFEAARLDAKFCSSKCRQKAYRLNKLSPLKCS